MTRPWVVAWIALVPLLLGAGPPVVKSAVPAPELDALFQRTDGWIGGDGAYSVAVSPKRTLWLFSDTWVGKVRDGRAPTRRSSITRSACRRGQAGA